MAKEQAECEKALVAAKERLAAAERNCALAPAGDPAHGVYQSALGMAQRHLERTQARYDRSLEPKLQGRDPGGELSAFLRSHRYFDVGYVSHGRTGDTPYASAVMVDAATALSRLQQHLRRGVRGFVRARTPDGGYGKSFYADQRMKSILALRMAEAKLSL